MEQGIIKFYIDSTGHHWKGTQYFHALNYSNNICLFELNAFVLATESLKHKIILSSFIHFYQFLVHFTFSELPSVGWKLYSVEMHCTIWWMLRKYLPKSYYGLH